jgi:hypothetical protein
MTPASWTYVGEADHFAVFRTNAAPQQAWVQRLGTDAYATHVPSSVRILSQSTNSETIAVHSPLRSILVRSSAWDAGWRAEIVSGTAASRDLVPAGSSAGGALAAAANAAVQSVGVLQGVDIPAGLSLVRFYYEGDGFSSGLTITAATLAGTVLGAILVVGLSRRKRRSPAALPPD